MNEYGSLYLDWNHFRESEGIKSLRVYAKVDCLQQYSFTFSLDIVIKLFVSVEGLYMLPKDLFRPWYD